MTLQSGYMKSLVKVAHESLKARCVVFNFRGRGGHPLKTPRTYCATNWEDLDSILGTVYILGQCTEVRFASFLSGLFITVITAFPPERKLAKCTSVQ